MNKTIKYIGFAAVTLVAAAMTSCRMDTPFGEEERGKGSLHLFTDIKGNTVTRAEIGVDEMKSLRERAVVYIERQNTGADRHDVIRKYFGLENIPGDISLAKGNNYLVEGWTGDSVSASFDAKFYRGKTEYFKVEEQTTVALKLNIANVLVSFAPETFDLGLTDLEMTVSHSRGQLVFSESAEGGSTLHNTGYFMMPSTDNSLNYSLSAKTSDGKSITREGVIDNVQRAHEYQVKLKSNDDPVLGGGLIKIEIEEIPVIEEEYEIFGRPIIKGDKFDISEQVVGTPGNFNEKIVYICGYNALSSLTVGGENAPQSIKNLPNKNLTNNSQSDGDAFEALGIHIVHVTKLDASSGIRLDTYTLYFTKGFLDNLPEKETEYVIEFEAIDRNGKKANATLRIANTEAAIEVQAPVEAAPAPDPNKSPMAITGSRAILTGYLYDFNAEDYGIEYRETSSSAWTKVSGKNQQSAPKKTHSLIRKQMSTRAEKVTFTVDLTGLKPGTTYEYRSYCSGYTDAPVLTFKTEDKFVIPNSSFEDWSSYKAKTLLGTKDVILPGNTGDKETSYWGSGNEGAATANMTLTDKSTDMKHSGQYSAKLASNEAMGVIAAGNIFTGSYVKTDGTNGVLSLGRPYNGSHPQKLKAWVNYRPGSGVSVKSGNEGFVPEGFNGGTDHGQIYVALTTAPVEIRTNPSNRKLFNKDDQCVLAYGEKTFTENFAPDGGLAQLEIPFVYNDRARTTRPTYLVIVVSASKYGDFFSGSSSSVFYLDDFELIY